MPLTLPGTAIPYDKRAGSDTYALISPIISATGGISLSQLSQLTGIESTTIQNWVKRGWVTPSSGKKYGERSVVRILLINIMRGTLRLEEIAQLMRIVNGDVVDMNDDILHDTQLYNLLCSVIYEVEEDKMQSTEEIKIVIEDKLPDGLDDREQGILESVLLIMVQSAISGRYRQLAEDEYEELSLNSDGGGKLKLKLGV